MTRIILSGNTLVPDPKTFFPNPVVVSACLKIYSHICEVTKIVVSKISGISLGLFWLVLFIFRFSSFKIPISGSSSILFRQSSIFFSYTHPSGSCSADPRLKGEL